MVKCPLVPALWFCTSRRPIGGSRGIALHFLDHGTRRGWGVSATPQPLFTPRNDPVPNVQEAGWAPRAGLDRCGKSRPHLYSIPRPSSSRYSDWATRATCFKSFCFNRVFRNFKIFCGKIWFLGVAVNNKFGTTFYTKKEIGFVCNIGKCKMRKKERFISHVAE